MRLLLAIIQIKCNELNPFYQRLLNVTLCWLEADNSCVPALIILKTVVTNAVKHEVIDLNPIGPRIHVFLSIFNQETQELLTDSKQQQLLGAVLQLLKVLLHVDTLRGHLLSNISFEVCSNSQ